MAKPYDGPWCLRTLLFVPGHVDKMLARGPDTEADCVVLDLEDAVPPKRKAEARTKIRAVLEEGRYAKKTVVVRINPIDSGLTLLDLEGVACPQLHGFIYPMAHTADDIKNFDAQLSLVEAHLGVPKGHFSVLVLIETPRAALNAYELAVASDRVVGLMFGCEDYLAGVQARYGEMDLTLHAPRSMIVMAARAVGIEAIDTPFVGVHDLDGLRVFATRARDLGMSGMSVLSPRQIPVAHEIYTPDAEEIRLAEKMVADARTAREEGRGVAVVDGEFVSPPTLRAAENLLARREAIRNLETFSRRSEPSR